MQYLYINKVYYEQIKKSWSLNLLKHSGPVQICTGIAFYQQSAQVLLR